MTKKRKRWVIGEGTITITTDDTFKPIEIGIDEKNLTIPNQVSLKLEAAKWMMLTSSTVAMAMKGISTSEAVRNAFGILEQAISAAEGKP